jgi:hypothetical protein
VNTYQRGNRDGLLNVALEMDAAAALEQAEVDRYSNPSANPATVARVRHGCLIRRETWRAAAALVRRRAEAMPEDPEATPAIPAPTREEAT